MAFSRARAGLRRSDHRLWLALLGVVTAAVAVIASTEQIMMMRTVRPDLEIVVEN